MKVYLRLVAVGSGLMLGSGVAGLAPEVMTK